MESKKHNFFIYKLYANYFSMNIAFCPIASIKAKAVIACWSQANKINSLWEMFPVMQERQFWSFNTINFFLSLWFSSICGFYMSQI